jgi:hypothetical protein
VVCAGLAIGCARDSTSEPTADAATIDVLVVRPSQWLVLLDRSRPVVQLEVEAYDQNGGAVGIAGEPAYSSDSPEIAAVDSRGLVTALSAGAARVTATVTDRGVTRSASMTVVVSTPAVASVSVHPTEAVLLAEPGQALQLTVEAYDEVGARIQSAPTYASSAAEVATVSSTGLIEAVGPGTATITAAVTASGVTRSDSMTVSVIGLPIINSVYDLTTSITSFDPAWGYDFSDAKYTAILRFERDTSIAGFVGTFSDLRITGGGVEPHTPMSGFMTRTVSLGRPVIELTSTSNSFHLTLLPSGDMQGSVMHGQFGCCGHISGTFTAVRRGGL